jgi:hypothetical protein
MSFLAELWGILKRYLDVLPILIFGLILWLLSRKFPGRRCPVCGNARGHFEKKYRKCGVMSG